MCLADTQRTFDAGTYGRVSNPDAAGYIVPTQAVSEADRQARLAAAREIDAAAPPPSKGSSSGGSAESGKGVGMMARMNDDLAGAAYRWQNPNAGANESRVVAEIARQNAQAQRDLRFVQDNPGYLAKQQAKAPNTAAAQPTGRGGGGSSSTLITGGTTEGALAGKKAQPQGRATLLGM